MVSLLRILLEMDGYEVVHLTEHADILVQIREEDPDLILMDVFLPDVNGMELLQRIRQDRDLGEARVVMTSGMDQSERSTASGADAFLLKPYTPEQLIQVIEDNLRVGSA
jgi:CheY-like chemotaxis protein